MIIASPQDLDVPPEYTLVADGPTHSPPVTAVVPWTEEALKTTARTNSVDNTLIEQLSGVKLGITSLVDALPPARASPPGLSPSSGPSTMTLRRSRDQTQTAELSLAADEINLPRLEYESPTRLEGSELRDLSSDSITLYDAGLPNEQPLPVIPLEMPTSNLSSVTLGSMLKAVDPPAGLVGRWKMKRQASEFKIQARSVIYDSMMHLSDPTVLASLQWCLSTCKDLGVSFDDLIQEKIEDHTPLYWAIVAVCHQSAALSASHNPHQPRAQPSLDVLDFLTSCTLSESTVADARQACMINDANWLFQTRRHFPTFEKLSFAESVMAGDGRGVTDVGVEYVVDDGVGTFRIEFRVPQWSTRMKVAKRVEVQWIARERAWTLNFSVAKGKSDLPAGLGDVTLSLLKDSAPTPIDGVLTLGSSGLSDRPALRFHKGKLEACGGEAKGKLVITKGKKRAAATAYGDSALFDPDGSLTVQGEFVLEKKDKRNKT